MRNTIRPAGSGRDGSARAFQRSLASPKAALVLTSSADMPGDWPEGSPTGATEDELGHALGWVLEISRHEIRLMNPLGEGIIKTDVPELATGWVQTVRHDGSCAVFLAAEGAEQAGFPRAGTVRTAFADDFGKAETVGRNEPCPCGSGKKYKHCCA